MSLCGSTDPHFLQCDLPYGHSEVHHYTIEPPEEFFEDELKGETMANEEVVAVKKPNRHVIIALAHLHKRRNALLEKRFDLDEEIAVIEKGIAAFVEKP